MGVNRCVPNVVAFAMCTLDDVPARGCVNSLAKHEEHRNVKEFLELRGLLSGPCHRHCNDVVLRRNCRLTFGAYRN